MKLRWLIVVVLLTALPTVLYARWIKDQVTFKVPATGEVNFSHYSHLETLGKNCPTCHNAIFDIVVEKNPAYTMADMEKGKSCGACHNGTKAFSVKDDCSACHPTKEIVFQVPAAGKTVFSHEVHTGMYGCGECHPGLFIPGKGNKTFTMAQMAEGEACGACHDGDTAFGVKKDCSKCHPTKDINFKVPDAGDVTFSHEVHTGMYGCSECHPAIFIPGEGNKKFTMDEMGKGEACGACHDGNTAFTVDDNCDTCHKM